MAAYATIEPRLIALLNDDPPESYLPPPSLELPPLQDPNILKASGRPLLLEPDAGHRTNKASSSQLVPQHSSLIAPLDDGEIRHESPSSKKKPKEPSRTDRALGSSSPQSLRKILDDDTGNGTSSGINKKRHLEGSGKEDFVQLPQPPPKKQKSAQQTVPPIIIGLFQPPPQATLFPPIASSSFHDSHGRNSLNMISPHVSGTKSGVSAEVDVTPPSTLEKKETAEKRSRRKGAKPYKKWTEEETSNLLKGVHKHGMGCWVDILSDVEFSFNDRTAVDLKDRFRTCCPVELRGKVPKPRKPIRKSVDPSTKALSKPTSSLMTENILLEVEESPDSASPNADESSLSSSLKTGSRRSHRKNLEDLAHLGIDGPFKKSQRRERRPFSDDDDCHILEGYKFYGTQWTKIQRDPRFELQSRTPTDLRDRFRNKFPEKFRQSEESTSKEPKKTVDEPERGQAKDGNEMPASSLTTSSSRECLKIQEMISSQPEKSTSTSTAPCLGSFKEILFAAPEQPGSLSSQDSLPYTQSLDWNEGMSTPFTGNIGDMDISRLLLDETWSENVTGLNNANKKHNYTNISSICTSSSDPLPQVMSFTHLLAYDTDSMSHIPSSTALDHDASFGWKSTMLSNADTNFNG
ncbi:MYB DNA-binding domain-containing protein [Phlyctema vagabunda]|uniref:MYB DNA-binding domain-containing protein n=1 Tax=Phlyctema vagabunda TaxID=108571 RepID=A0ABR4PA77_9HELO